MTNILGNWILGLGGAAIFCAVMTELCPKGPVKGIVKSLCGILMALALISPLMNWDMNSYSINLAQYRLMGEEIAAAGETEREALSRTFIEEECRAYILDKGQALGAELEDAAVKLRWSGDGFWYPVECELKGEFHPGLAAAISAELGIGEEGQKWSKDEGA